MSLIDRAGNTVPAHVPKPIRLAPGRSQNAFSVTVSPFSRKVRVSPLASRIGVLPPAVNSSSEPASPGCGPGADRALQEEILALQLCRSAPVARHLMGPEEGDD